MSKYRSRGLVLAMEADEEVIVDEVTADELPEATAEVEADAADVNEEMTEMDDLEGSIDDAAEGASELEQIQDVMEKSVADDGEGLDETAAEIAEIAIESICNRLGVKRKQSIIPAMESFGSKNTRVAATKIAIEGLVDVAKKIWNAIVEGFKEMMAKAKRFLVDLVSKTGGIVKAAEAAKAKAETLNGSPAKETIEDEGLASLVFNGSTSDSASLIEIMGRHAQLATVSLDSKDILAEVTSDIEAYVKSGEADLDKIKTALSKFGESFKGLANGKYSKYDADAGSIQAVLGPFLSARFLGLTIERGDTVGVQFKTEELKSMATPPKSVPTLSADEIKTLADKTLEVAKIADNYKKELPKFDAFIREVTKIANAAVKVMEKSASSEAGDAGSQKAKVAQAKKLVTDISKTVGTITSVIPIGIVNSGRVSIRYINASLAQYKAEKEEKAE